MQMLNGKGRMTCLKILLFISTFLYLGQIQALEHHTVKGRLLYRTETLKESQVNDLLLMRELEPTIEFWEEPTTGIGINIMVSRDALPFLEKFTLDHNILISKRLESVARFIRQVATMKNLKSRSYRNKKYEMDWNDYRSYGMITDFMKAEAANSRYVSVKDIGTTYEKRPIQMIAIEKAGPGKPNIFVEGGVHAREWISPAVTSFLIRELLEDKTARYYTRHLNFYIVPVSNPDGYEFSRSHMDNRLWRKNRRPINKRCTGVDLNRNFDFDFGGKGVSRSPCDDIYLGVEAFSEAETQALRDAYLALKPRPILAFSIHAALNKMLYGWAHEKGALHENSEEVIGLCEESMAALNKVNGQNFSCMHSPNLYETSGSSDDWYKDQGSRFTYTIELRDNGWSFILPPKFIIPSGEEMWAGFKVMLDRAIESIDEPLYYQHRAKANKCRRKHQNFFKQAKFLENNKFSNNILNNAMMRQSFNNAAMKRHKFSNAMKSKNFNNFKKSQKFSNAMKSKNFNNAMKKNKFSNIMMSQNFNNFKKSRKFSNAMKSKNFNNAMKKNKFSNIMMSQNFNNFKKSKKFSNAMRSKNFNNAMKKNKFSNIMMSQNFNNFKKSRNFNNAMKTNTFSNAMKSKNLNNAMKSNTFSNAMMNQNFNNAMKSNKNQKFMRRNRFQNFMRRNMFQNLMRKNMFQNFMRRNRLKKAKRMRF